MADRYMAKIEDEHDGLMVISLVTEGAVEVDWQMFDKDKELQTFAVQDEEKHLLLGCIMRADFDIYRRQGDYEYFIRYDRQTIEKMSQKMLKDHTFNAFNLQHNGETLPQGTVEMVQLFIKDTEKGIIPNGFDECADGSLFGVFKVNNEEIWDLCKQGVFNSFSLEGYFSVVKEEFKKETKKTIMSKIKDLIKKMLTEFASVSTDKGDIYYEGELTVGTEVADENGNPIADGEYQLEDGKTIVVADGKVAEIKEAETEEETVEETVEEVEVEAEVEETVEVEEETTEEETEETTEVEENNEIDELKAEIETLKTELEELKAKVAEIVSTPAVEPIVEEFSKVITNTEGKKGRKKFLDTLSKI